MPILFSAEEFIRLKKILPIYEWGLRTLLTKLDIINEDLQKFQNNASIEYIRYRIKSPESIAQKLHGMKLELTADNVKRHLRDVAGIRITCPFARDIYFLANTIRNIPDIKVVEEKDYVNTPKPGGYRSYHLITEVPIYFSDKTEKVLVEIQIRTEAMNFWATLEHKARYKFQESVPQDLSDELAEIADKIAELDKRMFDIHEAINKKGNT